MDYLPYPKVLYSATSDPITVASAEEHAALGDGFQESPVEALEAVDSPADDPVDPPADPVEAVAAPARSRARKVKTDVAVEPGA